ncbi:MAG: RNA polymerase sigma factor [Myxococcota bacterium]
MDSHASPQAVIEAVYRSDWGRILASLIRTTRDMDLAEEAVQEAFAVAADRWHVDGLPAEPRAWILATARNKAIDRMRRAARFRAKEDDLRALSPEAVPPVDVQDSVEDDLLRLIFTCCHPALAEGAQVALTLRAVCGLTTEEIARAFLLPVSTMAQRLVRAKRKIRVAQIPYRVPPQEQLAERLSTVFGVVYLVFNEGYASTRGERLVRGDLCREAIRLARILRELTNDRESRGLLALLLLHDARREARIDDGALILLEDQDRARWNRAQIEAALPLVEEALGSFPPGPYALQAAVAALHCRAEAAADTDWEQIAGIYGVMSRFYPSPVVELNRAVAVSMVEGPAAGLEILDALDGEGELARYHLLPAARADLLRQLGDVAAARDAYEKAIALVGNDPERRFLEQRLRSLDPNR